MDLKDIKRITQFAKRVGIKSLKVNGFEVVFAEGALAPKRRRIKLPDEPIKSPPLPEPTLQQINDFIYTDVDHDG